MTERSNALRGSRALPVIIQPTSTHTHTFILLHGLGNNGDRFGRELLDTGISSGGKRLPDVFPGAKFIFPNAEWRRSSTYNRAILTQWFDRCQLEKSSPRSQVHVGVLGESAAYIRALIDRELETLPSENIVLGGLSQGCAMSLMVLLGLDFSLGGYIGMSGWLPFRSDIEYLASQGDAQDVSVVFGDEDAPPEELDPPMQALDFVRDVLSTDEMSMAPCATKACLSTPVFLGHGARDEKVECKLGEEAARALASLGVDVTWKRYPELGHWYQVPEEIDDVIVFLREKVGLAGSCT